LTVEGTLSLRSEGVRSGLGRELAIGDGPTGALVRANELACGGRGRRTPASRPGPAVRPWPARHHRPPRRAPGRRRGRCQAAQGTGSRRRPTSHCSTTSRRSFGSPRPSGGGAAEMLDGAYPPEQFGGCWGQLVRVDVTGTAQRGPGAAYHASEFGPCQLGEANQLAAHGAFGKRGSGAIRPVEVDGGLDRLPG
jgi:hypothetical protein